MSNLASFPVGLEKLTLEELQKAGLSLEPPNVDFGISATATFAPGITGHITAASIVSSGGRVVGTGYFPGVNFRASTEGKLLYSGVEVLLRSAKMGSYATDEDLYIWFFDQENNHTGSFRGKIKGASDLSSKSGYIRFEK